MAIDPDIQRGIDLLILCQQLQSEKDGVDRPTPFSIDKTKTLDQFAMDIGETITLLNWSQRTRRVMMRLGDFAQAHPELIKGECGDSYSEKVVEWLEQTYPSPAKG